MSKHSDKYAITGDNPDKLGKQKKAVTVAF